MEKFVIIPDASCDMSQEMCKRFDIPELVRGIISFPDGSVHKIDQEWTSMSPEEFYSIMSDKTKKISTSVPSFQESVEIYEKYLAQGYDIITTSLSSALSGTYSLAVQASKEALLKYPERRIHNVDSMRYSTAHTLLVVMAAKLRLAGKTFDEVVEWVEKNKFCIHQMGPMDDLFFLARAGRINNFKAFFGTMAGINPMADFNRHGLSQVLVKCKGKPMSFAVTMEYVKKTIIDPENNIMFVAHTNRREQAEKLAEIVKDTFHPKELILTDVGMTCGANIGPGLCAVYYYGTELSEELVKEQEYINEAVENYKSRK